MFGLDLPALPGSYLTRQVTCVSCQEPFVVSEGRVVTATRDDGQRVPRSNWRPALDRLFSVRLRYEEDRHRQEVRSPSQAIPNIPHREPEENGLDNFINCPRCGADNRNWLQILSSRQDIVTDGLDLFLPRSMRRWRQRFPGAFLSIFLAILLGGVALLFSAIDSISLAQVLLMAFVAVVTAGLTASDLTSLWPQLRLQMHLRRFIPRRWGIDLDSPIARGVILIILFAGIFPWLFFQVAPRAMVYGSRATRPVNRGGNSVIISDKRQPPELYSDFETSFNREFASFFYNFDRMRPGNPRDVQFLILNLNQLNTSLTAQAEAYKKQLEAYLQDPPKTDRQVQDEAEAAQIRGIANNLLFLVLWFVIVGSANVFAVLLSNVAVKEYASFIDRQLPPPIFSNVANMTRVVTWEAKRALQIDGNMGHVQWMEVHRNEAAGINLVGLHRDDPILDRENSNCSQKVCAQRYFISTDRWGRIRDTTIRDVRVSRTVMSPAQRQLERSFEQRNPPSIIIHSPPEPSGGDLAQDFFAASSASSDQPRDEVVTEAVAQQSTVETVAATAVQVPVYLFIPPAAESESPTERKNRLCKGLALILNGIFTDSELQELYAGLNLNYIRIPGTRLEKCDDLVRAYRQRDRLAELVEMCINMHPNLLWGDIFELTENRSEFRQQQEVFPSEVVNSPDVQSRSAHHESMQRSWTTERMPEPPDQKQAGRDTAATQPETTFSGYQNVPSSQPGTHTQRGLDLPFISLREEIARSAEEQSLSAGERARRRYLRYELAKKMSMFFNNNELSDLCFFFGVDYNEDLRGSTRKEKCIELVKYAHRHGLLIKLTQKCIYLRPHALWGDVFLLLDL